MVASTYLPLSHRDLLFTAGAVLQGSASSVLSADAPGNLSAERGRKVDHASKVRQEVSLGKMVALGPNR